MRYSTEPREQRYVKGYGFLSFARTIGTHATKVAKSLNNKYGQKLVDSSKKSANLQQMHLKLLAKEQFKKRLKQLGI